MLDGTILDAGSASSSSVDRSIDYLQNWFKGKRKQIKYKEDLIGSVGSFEGEEYISTPYYGFLSKLENAQAIPELIAITREHLSNTIADRLEELYSIPVDLEEEKEISLMSAKGMLYYCWYKGLTTRPILTATLDGLLQLDWLYSSLTTSIRFLNKYEAIFLDERDTTNPVQKLNIQQLLV